MNPPPGSNKHHRFLRILLRLAVVAVWFAGAVKLISAAHREPSPIRTGIRAEPVDWPESRTAHLPVIVDDDLRDMETRKCSAAQRVPHIEEITAPCNSLVLISHGFDLSVKHATEPVGYCFSTEPSTGCCKAPIMSRFGDDIARPRPSANPWAWCAFPEPDGNILMAHVDGQYYRIDADLRRIDPVPWYTRVLNGMGAVPWWTLLTMFLAILGTWLVFRTRGGRWLHAWGVGLVLLSLPALENIRDAIIFYQ